MLRGAAQEKASEKELGGKLRVARLRKTLVEGTYVTEDGQDLSWGEMMRHAAVYP